MSKITFKPNNDRYHTEYSDLHLNLLQLELHL